MIPRKNYKKKKIYKPIYKINYKEKENRYKPEMSIVLVKRKNQIGGCGYGMARAGVFARKQYGIWLSVKKAMKSTWLLRLEALKNGEQLRRLKL